MFAQIVEVLENFSPDDVGAWIVLLCFFLWVLLPLYLLWKGQKHHRFVLLANCLPTSKARTVFIGLSEVKGRAVQEIPVVSYLSEKNCAWYKYTIEEEWEREETRVVRDSDGKTHSETRTRSGWTKVDGGVSAAPFRIQDDTGYVRVLPAGAEVEPVRFLSLTCTPSHALYYGKGPRNAIADSTHRRRFTEYGIDIGADLYILGTTREQHDCIHPEFAHADNGYPYFISTRKEESVVRRRRFWAFFLPFSGLAVYLLPGEGMYEQYGNIWQCIYNPEAGFQGQGGWTYAAMVFAGIWLLLRLWHGYNGMVMVRHLVLQGSAQVEVQLQRRHDLITRLVDVVEAYCRHEKELLDKVAEMRRMVSDGRLAALGEAYPGLRADTLFSRLQQELSDTEERLALAREYLNTIGNFYNTRLQQFPTGLLFRMCGFRRFRQTAGD